MILSIETATTVGSVALHDGEKFLASYELHIDRSHSAALTQLIEHLIDKARIQKSDLKAIALSKGPGSYTGLRIGTSTVKGLCYGLDIPLLSINTLTAMAHGVAKYYVDSSITLCPMIDARRMEVYTAYFSPDMQEFKETHAKIIDENSFENELTTQQVIAFGNGATKCGTVLQHENFRIINGIVPHAKEIGELAYAKFVNQEFEDLAYFEPFYLKDFIAGKPKNKVLGHLINR